MKNEPPRKDLVIEARGLNPAQKINLLTSLVHQAQRNHEYHPDACSECAMTQRIIDSLRRELKLGN